VKPAPGRASKVSLGADTLGSCGRTCEACNEGLYQFDISSMISGLESFRDAAADAARTIGHEVRRSEDFAASTLSPQRVCLEGVRWADVVVVLLGARYGDVQLIGSLGDPRGVPRGPRHDGRRGVHPGRR
jgi:hypothetical protein